MSISSCFSDFKLIFAELIWQQHRALNNLYVAGESWSEQFTGGENESWDPRLLWSSNWGKEQVLASTWWYWGVWAALHCFWGAETWLGIRLYHIHSPNSFEKTPPVPQIASPIQVFSALSIFLFSFLATQHTNYWCNVSSI